ncbi:MAG: hypothetical protein K8H84_08805 [Sulfuricella denitrificans]|nr:hypothetical protein [Sulfuricella denitrificans]
MIIRSVRGYTLIELATALTLLGLVGVLLWRFGGIASQRIAEIEAPQILTDASQALVGFVAANHRLPCPDTSATGDGLEHCGGAAVGRLPLVTLGLARMDLRNVRYGVYRSAVANMDTAADRFFPLVTTARDDPTLILLYAPSIIPPHPIELVYHYGSATAAETPLGQINGMDFCYKLRLAGTSTANSGALNIRDASGAMIKNVAYALALPGARDADGDGNLFDGSNTTAGYFSAPGQPVSTNYDDVVQVADFGQLFDRLACAGELSAAGHAHFNAATAAALMHAGFVNYKSQLQLAEEEAFVNTLLATSAVVVAGAGILAATASVSFAMADSLLSAGALSAELVLASVDLGIAIAAEAAAIATEISSVISWTGAIQSVIDFQPMLDESVLLETSVYSNAVAADAAGLY